MENSEIIDTLVKIPDLVKAAETFKETSDQIISTLAQAVKQRPQAEISENELLKLEERISKTNCASPDMNLVSRELAKSISTDVVNAISPIIKSTANEALKNTSKIIESSHFGENEQKRLADKKMTIKGLVLRIILYVEFLIIAFSCYGYYTSRIYLGKEFLNIYSSKYITQDEKNNLLRNSLYTGFLPKYCFDDSSAAQEQIQRNKAILKKRKKEAKKNKGIFNTEDAIY